MARVLVVDDDADIREGLRDILEDEGHDVAEARNGQDALARLRALVPAPDLILLDLMMPVMDGLEFRRQQLLDPALAGIPVVVLSADGHVDVGSTLLAATQRLRKPIPLDQLLALVERYSSKPSDVTDP